MAKLSEDTGWMGDRTRGASMGRPNRGALAPETQKWTLQRVRLDAGGYDSGGAYWGCGEPLYWACCGDVERFFRARDRARAGAHVRKEFPNAWFHR